MRTSDRLTTFMPPRRSSQAIATPQWALLVSLLLAVIVAACDGGGSEGEVPGDDDAASATGVVTDVRGSITEVEEFDLLLSDGTRLTIVPRGGVLARSGFSPAHLREHMALVAAISVTYREEDGLHILTGLVDVAD